MQAYSNTSKLGCMSKILNLLFPCCSRGVRCGWIRQPLFTLTQNINFVPIGMSFAYWALWTVETTTLTRTIRFSKLWGFSTPVKTVCWKFSRRSKTESRFETSDWKFDIICIFGSCGFELLRVLGLEFLFRTRTEAICLRSEVWRKTFV